MLNKDFTQSVWILIFSTIGVASFSLLAWVVPDLFMKDEQIKKSTVLPYTALQLAGRDIYISEGCHTCHSQMVRPLPAEVARYGEPTKGEDDIYEYPNLWGSKRTGPDLANVGRKYSDRWHEIHLMDPRNVVPTSIMPSYPWLFTKVLDGEDIADKMETLRILGVPYTDDEIDRARLQVKNKTYADALISYLQSLGE
ncbi:MULTISPECIES: cytochrome-c oxidase, cbb3-type subunit II [Vibrio]|uniref:Cytochrome-c oxidase, cbb3-type subunit II n=1 Tax=Vibrio algicola TaxID=2662262 RepID=A0A5Q0TMM3_9VIBR|nr:MULTISPECIES: cytochrome-c oxidase, cbb3-type subunit II [Vibrio]MBD1577392.1 cytochrome-c oxidase, cbb3-type subunit II [Vibrio sp. S11_S32]